MYKKKEEIPGQEKYEKFRARPNSEIHPKEKKKDYCKEQCEFMYSQYVRDKGGISFSSRTLFDELREFSDGRQPEDLYKPYIALGETSSTNNSSIADDGTDLTGGGSANYKKKGWGNINWQILSLGPKYKTAFRGKLDDIDYDMSVSITDEKHIDEEENKKWKLWEKAVNKAFYDQVKKTMGMPMVEETLLPESVEELDIFQAAGGFKANEGREIEKLCKHTEDVSGWDDMLSGKLRDDFIDLGVAGAKIKYDEEFKKYKWVYVNPRDAGIQYSKNSDYLEAQYAYEIEYWTIGNLRKKLKLKKSEEDKLESLAKKYCGYKGNPLESEWDEFSGISSDVNSVKYNDFKVPVFTAVWVDQDSYYNNVITDKNGNKKIKRQKHGRITKSDNRKTRITNVQKIYQCSWVINTDYVFDYGPMYNQIRDPENVAKIPYVFWKLPSPSIMYRCRPIFNFFQLAWLRLQNSMSLIFEEGYMIDVNMFNNIKVGGEKMTFLQAIEMGIKTGIFPYKSTWNGVYKGGAVTPIHKLPGGMGTRLNEAVQSLQLAITLAEQVTGINPVSLGATPNPEAPVQTTQMSLEGTNAILKPIIDGVFKMKQELARRSTRAIICGLKNNKEMKKAYARVIGANGTDLLAKARENNLDYGIKLIMRPTGEDRMSLIRATERAVEKGYIDISLQSYILDRMRNGGTFRELQTYLNYRIKKGQERQEFIEQRRVMQQQKQMVDFQRQKDIGELQRLDMDTKSSIHKTNNEYINKMKLERVKQNEDLYRELIKQKNEKENAD